LTYSLDKFTTEIYSYFQSYPGYLSAEVKQIITCIEKEDWLGSYRYINGVENGLQRISKKLSIRLRKRFFQQSDKNSNLAENTFENNFKNIDSKSTNIFALEAAVCELIDNYVDTLRSPIRARFPHTM
jgi:acyl carrier protein phosphodiesterase